MYLCPYCDEFRGEDSLCPNCLHKTIWAPSPEQIYGTDTTEGITQQIQKTWSENMRIKRMCMKPEPVELQQTRKPYYRRNKPINNN